MGTTTASKYGLRAAATEKRNKHAQRTPLPPRSGEIEGAREALRVAQEITGEPRSAGKAAAFVAYVEGHGWEATAKPFEGGVVEVTAKRGNETIWISWTNGAMTVNPMPTYGVDEWTIKLRNASAARQQAALPPEEGAKRKEKVATNKAFKPRALKPKTVKLPFDIVEATDAEIADALAGTTVEWDNRLSERSETAYLPEDPRRIEIVFTDDPAARLVKVCCRQNGYRAFRLSNLTSVSGATLFTKGGGKQRAKKKAGA